MAEIKKFEDALQELEAIVKKLEGDIPLDEAVKAFEKGIELSKVCIADLKAEKGKLALLVDDINNLTEELKPDRPRKPPPLTQTNLSLRTNSHSQPRTYTTIT